MQNNVTKFIEWKENNLPIKVKISLGRTRAEAGTLVSDGETIVLEFKLRVKVIDLVNNQTFGMWFEARLKDRFEVGLGQRRSENGDFLFLMTNNESIFVTLTKNYLILLSQNGNRSEAVKR